MSALQRLRDLSTDWASLGDRRAIFADAYGRMTAAMVGAIPTEGFADRVWVESLLDRFAHYYFDAVEAHEQPDGQCPAVWSEAFDACVHPDMHPLQVLFMGINAHINHDLVFALADVLEDWQDLEPGRRETRFADHDLVNRVIARTVDEVQHEVVAVWSPGMATVDALLGRFDEWMFSRLIAEWRDQVWLDAVRLIETPTLDRDPVIEEVVRRAQRNAAFVTRL